MSSCIGLLCTVYMQGPQRTEEGAWSLRPELQAVVSYLMCVMETKPGSSARVLCAPNCLVILFFIIFRWGWATVWTQNLDNCPVRNLWDMGKNRARMYTKTAIQSDKKPWQQENLSHCTTISEEEEEKQRKKKVQSEPLSCSPTGRKTCHGIKGTLILNYMKWLSHWIHTL